MQIVRLLTWNTALLPAPFGYRNLERAAAMVGRIADGRFDVVCLQEVFDEKARTILMRGLVDRFPGMIAKSDGSDPLKQDSGLFFASRFPIGYRRFISFRDRVLLSNDFFADKGVLLVRLELGAGRALLVGSAHLQSDIGHDAVRIRQADAIRRGIVRALPSPSLRPGTGVVLAGDFNVVGDLAGEYGHLLSTLGDPRDLYRERHTGGSAPKASGFTWDASRNTLIHDHNRKDTAQQRLDYVFAYDRLPHRGVGDGGRLARVEVERIELVRWRSGSGDLSDHFALAGTLQVD
jgi:endonuclease/exonuclease/phosphatase family metal-dependent hydrolase